MKLLILLIWIAAPGFAFAQTPATDCLIDQVSRLPSFEATMGYKIDVAQDGTAFKPEEKVAFSQVAAILPEFYRSLSTLRRFERVPDGYVIAGGPYGAAGEYSNGQITLIEDSVQTRAGRFAGGFQRTVIHELTHALDYALRDFSLTKEWSGLSTWGPDGQGTSKNFVTEYAAAGPEEDFAESMTTFLLSPDDLLRLAPTKFELISRKFYNGRRFDRATLEAQYAAALQGLSPEARAARVHEMHLTDYYACQLIPR